MNDSALIFFIVDLGFAAIVLIGFAIDKIVTSKELHCDDLVINKDSKSTNFLKTGRVKSFVKEKSCNKVNIVYGNGEEEQINKADFKKYKVQHQVKFRPSFIISMTKLQNVSRRIPLSSLTPKLAQAKLNLKSRGKALLSPNEKHNAFTNCRQLQGKRLQRS